ncbi:hypothetical protein [Methanoregula sp.]|uniref:hypothetical protein n=1 Tax=Methanoregula sp. TaxID=2052170 RepID=UPI003BAF1FE0
MCEGIKNYSWDIGAIGSLLVITVLLYSVPNFPIDGIKNLLPNYIVILTAFLAVTFAAIAINSEIRKHKKAVEIIQITLIIQVIGILCSFVSLYWSYLTTYTVGVYFFFWGATVSVVLTIFTTMYLANGILKSKTEQN